MSIVDSITKDFKSICYAIKGGIIYILSGNILSKAISMVASIIVARVLTKELYAYYSYMTNIYSYVELLNGLELSGALLVLCSKTDNDAMNKSYYLFSMKIGGMIQLVVSFILCIVVLFASITYPEAKRYFLMYLLVPVLTVIINNNQSVLRAYRKNKIFSITGIIKASIFVVFSIALIPTLKVEGIIISTYLACIAAILFGGRFCYKKMNDVEAVPLTIQEKKNFLLISLSLFVASFFSYLMPLNETLLVNTIIADEITTANFRVAGLIPAQLSLISGAICVYFYPIIARIKDGADAWKKLKKIELYTASLIFLAAFLGIVLTPLLIRILYGEKYMDSIYLSRVLWIMRMVGCAFRVVPMTFLPALGDTKFNLYFSPLFCIFHVILDYYMILNYGIDGVAFASIITYILTAILAWAYLRRFCFTKKII